MAPTPMPSFVRIGLVTGLYLASAAPLIAQLPYGDRDTFVALAAYFWFLGFALSAIEGAVFTAGPAPVGPKDWLGGLAFALGLAGLGLLLPRAPESASLAGSIEAWFSARGRHAWFAIGYASIAYMVAYCVIGSATWPFVRRFYEDPSLGLRLRVPSAAVLLPLQVTRGFVATLAVLGLLVPRIALGASTADVARLAGSVAVLCGIAPMLLTPHWPPRLRVYHAVEITCFAIVQSAAWCWLLGR